MKSGRDDTSMAGYLQAVQWPGLTPSAEEIDHLKNALQRELAAYSYKKASPSLWVVFMGGTGTGKSTLFNALCGKNISEAGVERPKTQKPVVYIYSKDSVGEAFPFREFQRKHIEEGKHDPVQQNGITGNYILAEHHRDEIKHIALIDTPDLDSLEIQNRQMAEDFYLLADVIVFISSQEKYSDEVPSRFFYRIYQEEIPYYFLLNKADKMLTREDVLTFFQQQEIKIPNDHFWLIPYISSPTCETISSNEEFDKFSSLFFEKFSKTNFLQLHQEGKRRNARKLSGRINRLLNLLKGENLAGREWLEGLDAVFEDSSRDLLEQFNAHYKETSRTHLQNEVRKIFNKYDLLRKPRRYIGRVLLAPFRFFGLKKTGSSETHTRQLLNIGQKVDISPVLETVERFNRLVLERLSPRDNRSPLYNKMRETEIPLTNTEIRSRVLEEQEKLALWVEETFRELAGSIPKSKKWGIYSTSILWGIIILSFEIVLGGGISILEAALDSVLAPMVTRGSAELFASHEIKKIARDLNHRYRNGLLSILQDQKDGYKSCLASLTTSREVIEGIRSIDENLEN
jgi:GTP-binding protein EngB required for normal cell division